MALTRKLLKSMGIEEEKIDQIIDAHAETVDALKEKLKTAEADGEKLKGVQKELDDLKANGDYKDRYEAVTKEFEDYKTAQAQKETQAAKEKAAKAYFEAKGITGANLDIAMRGAKEEISGLELDGDNIKDAKALSDLVSGTYAGLIVTKTTQGAATATPPANTGGTLKSRAEIYARDEHGRFKLDAMQRQEALAKIIDQKG